MNWSRILTPRVIIPASLALVAIIVLSTPHRGVGVERAWLSSHSAKRGGARGLYEAADRLGWTVARRNTEYLAPLRSDVTYLVLAPRVEVAPPEVGALLAAVRDGAHLLYVLEGRSTLSDSLQLTVRRGAPRSAAGRGMPAEIPAGEAGCRSSFMEIPYGIDAVTQGFRVKPAAQAAYETFAVVQRDTTEDLVAAGWTLGAGRVLVISDAEILRNDAIRHCDRKEGVFAARMLAWLSPPGERTLHFDEYHHGYGLHPGLGRALRRGLLESAPGRMLLQVVLAALILLLAAAARPLAPVPGVRIERRSPLEHVGALSRAYEQIGATRRAVRLLLRGLRRRRDPATWKRGTDEEFLRSIADVHRRHRQDVELLREAGNQQKTPHDLIEAGRAIENIERTLTREYR